MSNGKRDKKKAQKKQHVSPPATRQNKSAVAKPKSAAKPGQRRRAVVSMKIFYAVAAVLLILSGVLVAVSRDTSNATAVATPNVGNFSDRTPVADQSSIPNSQGQ